jgi:hypothetical protein
MKKDITKVNREILKRLIDVIVIEKVIYKEKGKKSEIIIKLGHTIKLRGF